MNNTQLKMFHLLKDLKENHGVIGIKAEFEAEGTRINELTALSGLELILACSCLAKTIQAILPAESYEISSTGGKLNGKSSILITPNTFIWEDTLPES